MSEIIIAFSRRTKIPITFTKLMTSGDIWSHCGIVVPGDEDSPRGYIVEALAWHGVVKTPIVEWMAKYPFYDFVPYEVPDAEAGIEFALAQVGKKYDYLGMIGAPWRSGWDDPNRWYCSELVEAVLKAAGSDRWRGGKRGVRPMETYLNKNHYYWMDCHESGCKKRSGSMYQGWFREVGKRPPPRRKNRQR